MGLFITAQRGVSLRGFFTRIQGRIMTRTASRLALTALAVALAACGDGGSSGGGGDFAARGPQAIGVIAHEIAFAREQVSVETVGTARALRSAIIFPETSGEVTDVRFAANDYVEAGDLLLQLESSEERLDVNLARVAVEEAPSNLAVIGRYILTPEIMQNLQKMKSGAGGEIQLTDAIADVDAGARINANTEIARLDDRSTLFIDFNPPEQVFGRIVPGETVTVTPFSDPTIEREAEILAVDSQIDPNRRTFTVRAQIDNSDDRLRPGMSFSVRFSSPGGRYAAVPEAAILWGSDGSYVWRIEDNAAQRTPVAIVSREEGRVLVRGDLQEGEMIVSEGVQKVRAGAPLELVSVESRAISRSGDMVEDSAP